MYSLLYLFAAIAVSFATIDAKLIDLQYESLFTKWISQHNKVYALDEFFSRFHTFKMNLDMIHAHNSRNYSYTLAMNQFGDMTAAEFAATMTGFRGNQDEYLHSQNQPHHLKGVKVAESVDWREKAVTHVKNGGQCLASWAFSATGAVEGAHAIATGKLVSLSEQQLLDCSSHEGNNGCTGGGIMDNAFTWIVKNGGITGEADYPYLGKDDICHTTFSPLRAKIRNYTDLPRGDEATLLQAVNIGPVSIALEAHSSVFRFYSGGVLDDSSCGNTANLGALIVGYGTDSESGKKYWIVKNSWGASWGEKGYVRLVRNKNMCGLADRSSYPTGAQ